MSEEIWKDCFGLEDRYRVSTHGRVIAKNYARKGVEKELKTGRKNTYSRVAIYDNGKTVDKSVHRMVAETFIPRIDGKNYVNHKDGNKQNNHVDNLEWVTKSEDIRHRLDVLKTGWREGIKRGDNKRAIKINKICPKTEAVLETFDSLSSVKDSGMDLGNIWCCLNGHKGQKTAYGFKWKYA